MTSISEQMMQTEVRRVAREIENGLSSDISSEKYVEILKKIEELVEKCEVTVTHVQEFCHSDIKAARTIFRENYFARCCSRLLRSFSVDLLTHLKKQHSVILDNIFRHGPADTVFLVLTSTIVESSVGFKLNKCVSLLEGLLSDHKLEEIFWEQSCLSSDQLHTSDHHVQDQLITAIISLPEIVANKLQNETSDLFYPKNYVRLVCGDIYKTLVKVRGCLADNKTSSLEFVSKVLGRLCLAGHADLVWECLLPLLYSHVHADYVWSRVCERVVTGVPTRCLESTITVLLKHLPWYGLAGKFLGDCVVHSQTVQHLLCTKLIFHRHTNQVLVLQNIIGYLASSHTRRHLYMKMFLSMLEVWADGSSVKHMSHEQHLYISRAVLICVGHLNDQEKAAYKDEFLRLLMPGISSHIGHSDPKLRKLGMVVAETLTLTVDPTGPKLNFEYDRDSAVDSLTALTAPPVEPSVEDLARQFSRTEISNPAKTSDESEPELTRLGTSTSSVRTPDSDLDSDDDLEPFDMSHDVPRTTVSAPKYVRDCMEGLLTSDDMDRLEVCLQTAETLIRKKPDGLEEISAEFVKILLHLGDNSGFVEFRTCRFAAMVALTVQCPVQVASYLTGEFYERNYNLRQRMDILEVLAAAAQELSRPTSTGQSTATQGTATQGTTTQGTSDMDEPASWRQVVERRIESKTRRFGKGRSRPLPTPVLNKFADVCGHFFYPLMKYFDRKENTFDLLAGDTLVLGRLIYTLGMILYAAINTLAARPMGTALLQFTWGLRFNSDVFVRQSVLFATSMVFLVVPGHILLSDLQTEMLETKTWLEETADKNVNTECQKMAVQALVLLDGVIKQEFHSEASVT